MRGGGRGGGRGGERGGGRGGGDGGRGGHPDGAVARGGGRGRGRGGRDGNSPRLASNAPLPVKVQWLREQVAHLHVQANVQAGSSRWDAPQFLHELVGKDCGAALEAAFGSISEPGAVEIIYTLLPALALADVREALDKESANRAYLLLLSPASKPAWDALPRRVATPQLAYNACVIAAHCLDLQSDAFWVMPLAELAAAARAAAVASVSTATPSAAALRAAADALDVKGAHAQGARAAAEDRAAAAASAAAPRPLALRSDEVSTDAQLEAFARDFRTSSVPPTREDIIILGGGPRDTRAAAGGDGTGGDADNGERGATHYLHVPALPYNRTRGTFPSLNAYIATHFRLLREDSIAALRKGLLAVRDGAPQREVNSSCRTYAHVRSVGAFWGKRRMGWRLRFARPGSGKIGTRVLITGSLLCLVPRGDTDLKRIVFATVASRDEKLLDDRKGPFIDIEEVIYDTEVVFGDYGSDDDYDDDGGAMFVRRAALHRASPAFDETAEYTMYESSAYFEAYRHVLSALQAIPDNPTRLPFCEELLGGAATRAPAYLDAPGAKPLRLADAFPHFLAATGSETLRDVRAPWPVFDSNLNQSQLEAVQLALRNRVALIQGPPGCGKTHVGVLLTRLLLASSPDRPLLFVCYTNHALDQLLEHVHTFEENIVRVGSRSQSELMQSLSLPSWRERDRNVGNSPEKRKIGFDIFTARSKQMAAKRQIELAFEAATTNGMKEQDLATLPSFVPWVSAAVQLLLARRHLLKSPAEARAEVEAALRATNEAAERVGEEQPNLEAWQVPRAEKKRRKREARANAYKDILARFLHVRGNNEDDDGSDDDGGGEVNGGGDGVAQSDAIDDARAVVENEELALNEAARRADTNVDEGTRDAAFVNQCAVTAARNAERAAARGGGGGGGGGEDGVQGRIDQVDDEAGVSDEDIEGGGPQRAAQRRGQQVLSHMQLFVWCDEQCDPWKLSLRNRRELIKLWCDARADAARSALASARAAYDAEGDMISALESRRDGLLLRKARVIGFTTTGAARARRLLESVAPKVLIVEEAAEVLESHVLAALVPSVQHAVLIGDHQQLRPKVETIDLARRHALSVSMFERLINNNVPHISLDTQHRMRPEFAALLTPSIYPRLLNAPTTRGRPHVRGAARDSYFVSHKQPETSSADRGGFGGYANVHEAGLIVSFSEYLLRNGARGGDIVVLVAYQSQATLIRTKVLERISALQAAFARGGAGATVLGLHEAVSFAEPPSDRRHHPTGDLRRLRPSTASLLCASQRSTTIKARRRASSCCRSYAPRRRRRSRSGASCASPTACASRCLGLARAFSSLATASCTEPFRLSGRMSSRR